MHHSKPQLLKAKPLFCHFQGNVWLGFSHARNTKMCTCNLPWLGSTFRLRSGDTPQQNERKLRYHQIVARASLFSQTLEMLIPSARNTHIYKVTCFIYFVSRKVSKSRMDTLAKSQYQILQTTAERYRKNRLTDRIPAPALICLYMPIYAYICLYMPIYAYI